MKKERMYVHVALCIGFGDNWVLLDMDGDYCPGKLTCLESCQLL